MLAPAINSVMKMIMRSVNCDACASFVILKGAQGKERRVGGMRARGDHGLVDRCVELAGRLVTVDAAPAQIARGGRKAHDLDS